ncbi:MAG TPA: lysophospholipid acyltransferase family protein [Acidimicrobiales bacterium]|nr:lysophospholipid acyltransferase family protein [Acidimicrobiales bacterium]
MSGTPGDDREYGKLYPVARAILVPLFRAAWRVYLKGVERLPAEGPAIICPNHTSVLDSFLLPSVLPRRITFVGKAEYMDDWKTRHLFPAMGMIPIDRSGGDASARALDTAARVLGRGELFGIYPEGTRSRDGRLHKGHTGPARLALRTGAPLVPVGIVGTVAIQPPEAKLPRLFQACEIRIGRPIDPRHHGGRADDRLVLRQLTDELMFEVRELSGQEYVDEYATKRPEALPSQPAAIVPDGQGDGRQEPAGTGAGTVSAAR